jgi:hypothetical protein
MAEDGVANSGSGGGGGCNSCPGGNGGDGVVIIRYLDTFDDPHDVSTDGVIATTAAGYKIYTFTKSGTITF